MFGILSAADCLKQYKHTIKDRVRSSIFDTKLLFLNTLKVKGQYKHYDRIHVISTQKTHEKLLDPISFTFLQFPTNSERDTYDAPCFEGKSNFVDLLADAIKTVVN